MGLWGNEKKEQALDMQQLKKEKEVWWLIWGKEEEKEKEKSQFDFEASWLGNWSDQSQN